MSELCCICPRECNADRKNGRYGYCGMSENPVIARVSKHMWEEPCISGEKIRQGNFCITACGML